MYDKLELLVEGFDPFSIYDGKRRWNGGRTPKYPLILKKIRFERALTITLQGTVEVEDLVTVLDVTTLMMATGTPRYWWQSKRQFEKAIRKYVPAATRKEAAELAKKYDLSPDRLFGYVAPEIDMLYQNRAKPVG